MLDPHRLEVLRDAPIARGKYVLYWMQASQRTRDNHALEYAIDRANQLDQPIVVTFGLMDDYPEANERHYAFMLQGLRDVAADLRKRGIAFVVRHGAAAAAAIALGKHASLIVCDRGYQRHQKRWRDEVADAAVCRVEQVESDVVVPVETASVKQEYAARTIRPKIHKQLERFLVPLKAIKPQRASLALKLKSDLDVNEPEKLLQKLKLDRSVRQSRRLIGGQEQAQHLLQTFISRQLDGYAANRNSPASQRTSMMAAYLHFGHISPLTLALAVQGASTPAVDRESYLEELIIRRELAVNYVHYNPRYDQYDGLPDWARKTLAEHKKDLRDQVYTIQELESAQTYDAYWNAAQREMTLTGFMHNYMRMYWGKKVLQWKPSPEEAFKELLYLNNKYFLCGRDPNAYANVAWIFGYADRPWSRRPIFGTIRYMSGESLGRKFDMEAYVKRVEEMGDSA